MGRVNQNSRAGSRPAFRGRPPRATRPRLLDTISRSMGNASHHTASSFVIRGSSTRPAVRSSDIRIAEAGPASIPWPPSRPNGRPGAGSVLHRDSDSDPVPKTNPPPLNLHTLSHGIPYATKKRGVNGFPMSVWRKLKHRGLAATPARAHERP